jgi:hypothetical protein
MQLSEINIDAYSREVIPSPGKCIYCGRTDAELTEEHVIPFALAANVLSIAKACCETCQRLINRYEQGFLSRQIGHFRSAIGAPSRTKPKKRRTHVRFTFTEIDNDGRHLRELGYREIPLAEAPLVLPLWQSPPPSILGLPIRPGTEMGRRWVFQQTEKVDTIAAQVGKENGALIVKTKTGEVSREDYLRWLAKTAHGFAVARFGLDAFDPFLLDIILGRAHDMERYVGNAPSEILGDLPGDGKPGDESEYTLSIFGGEETIGTAAGCIVVVIQVYPFVRSPTHLIVVGRAKIDIAANFAARPLATL